MPTKAEQEAEKKKQQEEEARKAAEQKNGKGNTPEGSPAMASLSLKRTYAKRLVNAIASLNNIEVEEHEDCYLIASPFIRVNRSDVEHVAGKMSDAKWRMLFVNRSGEIREFTNERFIMGTPVQATQAEDEKDVVQINVRIDSLVKADVDKYRSKDFLDLTQNAFVEEALREFIVNIKKDLL
ncbi:hypothetical protein [Paenibacillus illinoisensis]|uniref:hypothetical protein n=1 Tax=Paenibacillus illinoisensis TaxID=59845 RepID=UPI0030173CA1